MPGQDQKKDGEVEAQGTKIQRAQKMNGGGDPKI